MRRTKRLRPVLSGVIGLWAACVQVQAGPAAPFLRGDVNADSRLDLRDALGTLCFLFAGSSERCATDGASCQDAADVDDNGRVTVSDAVFLLEFFFRQGPQPPPPFPSCGPDATPDALSCETNCTSELIDDSDLNADTVLFLVERTAAMQDAGELARVRSELVRAVRLLPDDTEFAVVFFDAGAIGFPASRQPVRPTAEVVSVAAAWIERAPLGAGRCLRSGLTALREYVDAATPGRRRLWVFTARSPRVRFDFEGELPIPEIRDALEVDDSRC